MQSPPLLRNNSQAIRHNCPGALSVQCFQINNQIGGPRVVGAPYLVELGCSHCLLRHLNRLARLAKIGHSLFGFH